MIKKSKKLNQGVIEDVLIKYPTFINAHEKLEECYEVAGYSNQPMNLAILGHERSGKSTIIETFASMYPRVREPKGMKVPILSIELPAKPTVVSIVECMLEEIGDQMYTSGTKGKKIARLKKLIKNTGVRMIIIDEFQHLIDKGTLKIAYEAADWLKGIVNECKVSLVVAGLPNAITVFSRNKQFRGRFNAPIYIPIYDWRKADDRQELGSTLKTFHDLLSENFECLKLNSPDMAFRFYIATRGRIGYIWKIFRQLELNKLREDNSVVTLSDIQIAFNESMMMDSEYDRYQAPFSECFNLPITDGLIDEIINEQLSVDDGDVKPKRKPFKKLHSRDILTGT